MTELGTELQAGGALDLVIADAGLKVANMGGGVAIVDQVDFDTKRLQRVVLTKADLEAMLAWMA